MAFPTNVGVGNTGISTAATPHTVNLFTTTPPAAGHLLIGSAIANVGGAAFTFPAGWTKMVDVDTTGFTSTDRLCVFYKLLVAGDAEIGASTISVTPPASSKGAYLIQTTAGADVPGSISAAATGSSTTPDAPSHTPPGGAQDYHWLALGGWEGEQTSPPTTPPTNYTHAGASSGTTGNVDTNNRAWIARRSLNAATEDPPAVTISVADEWQVYTLAVPPAGVAASVIADIIHARR